MKFMHKSFENRRVAMPVVRFLEHGQVTIPKRFRDTLGIKQGDLAEAELEGERIVITPMRLTKAKAWQELFAVLDKVHQKNAGVSEEEITRDVLSAIERLRQDEYAQAQKTEHHS
jgi:AbrB family looped-hinge helix DNA binding protein